jgi:cell division initiation protein
MDVSPQLLREVEFREQWRGYNPDEVDDFLERVASALEQLQDRLRETADRAARAERRATETDDDGQLRRTLVLAQRTADAAVQEATDEAARLRADAEEQAGTLLAEARLQAEQLTSEAEERAAVELGNLTERRRALEADVAALTAYVDEARRRLAEDLRSQVEWLENPDRSLGEPPELHGVPVVPEPAPVPPPDVVPDVDEAIDLAGEEPTGDALPGTACWPTRPPTTRSSPSCVGP